jgi:pimeloyl-ACP methyl ester carboxylesterase
VVDVVFDTDVVLSAIGAGRCLVAGWSGGGPHALACAARLEQAAAVLVIAGVAPSDAQGLDWAAGMGEDNVAEFAAALQGEGPLRSYLEVLAFAKPWGFDLDEIDVPTSIWQGSADLMVPYAHGEWLSAHVPGVSAHLAPGEGHLSVGLGALERMLDELVAA